MVDLVDVLIVLAIPECSPEKQGLSYELAGVRFFGT